jgi:hypothetical protein
LWRVLLAFFFSSHAHTHTTQACHNQSWDRATIVKQSQTSLLGDEGRRCCFRLAVRESITWKVKEKERMKYLQIFLTFAAI